MLFDIKDKFVNFITDRLFLLYVITAILFGILTCRIFNLQIIHGDDYFNNFSLSTQKDISIPGSRGNIYDRNGVLLAYNELAYSVVITDVIESGPQKNLELNSIINKMNSIILENGDSIECDFAIYLDEDGNYRYSVSDAALLRFLADVYGRKLTSDLLYSEKNANPDEVIYYLAGSEKYGIGTYLIDENNNIDFIPGLGFNKEEILNIIKVRYNLSLNAYQKYISTTVSSEISDKTVAAIMENMNDLDGVSIEENFIRKYNNAVYFSPIIGYVGHISQEEYDLYSVSGNYTTNDIVGKTGIEYSMESVLQGIKGSETIFVDNQGRIIETSNVAAPVAGNDIYLTIDSDLQIAMYNLLEQKIASILITKIRNVKTVDEDGRNPLIPIYDVYFALFNNNVINLTHMGQSYAGDTEQTVYSAISAKKEVCLENIRDILENGTTMYKNESEEYQAYESIIVNMLLSADINVLLSDAIDTTDPVYQQWKISEDISIKDFLNYCISAQWVDLGKLQIDNEYADTNEIYAALVDYIINKLSTNRDFTKKIIKYMILSDTITPRQIILILWEQDIIQVDESEINNLKNGVISSYDFMTSLISNLKITPAQLGLEPCSGSIVITDTNNGEVLALVSYPGYDNNKLANNADMSYLAALNADLSKPLWNYATQQRTAPGSTFKMVVATAGVMEGVINTYSTITCTGVFDKLNGVVHKCHCYPGSHGALNVSQAIKYSCNCFFYEVGYRLADDSGVYNDGYGIDRLYTYADLYGLSEKSGVEITESEPMVSDQYPVASAIGQGTNNFTTVGLARYITAIANNGTVYNLSLINSITDYEGNYIYTYTPNIRNTIELPDSLWDSIHTGMRGVVQNKAYFNNLQVDTAGKTGTAQEATNKANHAWFVGYAPYNNPEMCVAIRIANGYTSDYTAQLSVDVYRYYFDLDEEENILTGTAETLSGTIGGD